MNVILEMTSQVRYFTNMRMVLDALGIAAESFDWYVSDVETNYNLDEFSSGDRWIAGEDLERLLRSHEIQFIWAVFSAVPKGFRAFVVSPPYADGNRNYWSSKEIPPQLPGALFEIACWDSSATILIGLPDDAVARFCQAFPDTKALASAA